MRYVPTVLLAFALVSTSFGVTLAPAQAHAQAPAQAARCMQYLILPQGQYHPARVTCGSTTRLPQESYNCLLWIYADANYSGASFCFGSPGGYNFTDMWFHGCLFGCWTNWNDIMSSFKSVHQGYFAWNTNDGAPYCWINPNTNMPFINNTCAGWNDQASYVYLW